MSLPKQDPGFRIRDPRVRSQNEGRPLCAFCLLSDRGIASEESSSWAGLLLGRSITTLF
jgi:hypothetical protein